MTKNIRVGGGIAVGIIFIGIAVFYWMTPAGHLPTFVPGYLAGSPDVHFKHGLAAAIVAFLGFAFAWFSNPTTPSAVV
jgi:hypothetical protein